MLKCEGSVLDTPTSQNLINKSTSDNGMILVLLPGAGEEEVKLRMSIKMEQKTIMLKQKHRVTFRH
jgi:hypothetical protein